MNYTKTATFLLALVLLTALLHPACRKPDSEDNNSLPENNNPPGGSTVDADTLFNHLIFFGAVKRQGAPPAGPGGAGTVRISIKDTLYLTGQAPGAIKFLHKDTTKNVAGVFIQVLGGSASTQYYDVPELKNMEDNDTVSVIMVGIEPEGLQLPHIAEISLTPYDEKGSPITRIVRPVKIIKPKVDLPVNSANACGLELPSGKRWEWDLSVVMGDAGTNSFAFYNEPNKVHSGQGQNIEGSCCKNGQSKYPEYCVGEREHNKTLHFATYYRINFETFQFFGNGSFFRQTMEDAPVPLPAESDFCAGGSGKVQESLKHTQYNGNWTLMQAKLPPDYLWKNDTLHLSLQTTSSIPDLGGYGNPGGVIHQLDCQIGALVLVQLDREGRGRHLFKFYSARTQDESPWFD